ncbi:Trypsin-2 [Frankliniella fusca]|uniref:Trypsin-2 n=1 Tax=Frankliniella fusca TaxID=407009 RepID=A0AAE1HQG6_9NEOP|nr:Trypsin-2 [Frankliniella fusca]
MQSSLIVVLGCLAVCHGLPRPHPRLPPRLLSDDDSSLQIVGGLVADIKDFPYQISMMESGSHICGGSILNEQWVLTAGHCVHALYGDTDSASVRAGSSSRVSGGQVVNVIWAEEHPQFDYDTVTHDVALMKLEKPLTLDGVVAKPTQLVPLNAAPAAGQLLTVSGWGTLHSGDFGLPTDLYAVMVPSMPLDVCKQVYDAQGDLVDETMICAGIGGKDSCQGDSGGPLVDDQHVQVGVVSWGIGCGSPGYPGLYANLAHPELQQWIIETSNSDDE